MGRVATAPGTGRGGKRRVASGLAIAIVLLGLTLGGYRETESSPSAQARWDHASWDEAAWPDAKGE